MAGVRAGAAARRALSEGRRGRVVAVHARAANLLMDDGALVGLLPAGAPLHPWAIAAPVEPARLAEGDAVHVADGALHAGGLRVALAGAEVCELRLARRPAAIEVARLAPFAPPAASGPFAAPLAAALAEFRAGGPAARLAALVGLGEGLTPAGDDALVGALAALEATGKSAARRALVEAVAPRLSGTTRLAAQMLAAAIEGAYAEPLLALLEALGEPDAALAPAVDALLAVGHTTGADTLRGVLAALARAG